MVETIICRYLRWRIIRNQGFLGGTKWISQPSQNVVTNPCLAGGWERTKLGLPPQRALLFPGKGSIQPMGSLLPFPDAGPFIQLEPLTLFFDRSALHPSGPSNFIAQRTCFICCWLHQIHKTHLGATPTIPDVDKGADLAKPAGQCQDVAGDAGAQSLLKQLSLNSNVALYYSQVTNSKNMGAQLKPETEQNKRQQPHEIMKPALNK